MRRMGQRKRSKGASSEKSKLLLGSLFEIVGRLSLPLSVDDERVAIKRYYGCFIVTNSTTSATRIGTADDRHEMGGKRQRGCDGWGFLLPDKPDPSLTGDDVEDEEKEEYETDKGFWANLNCENDEIGIG